MAENFQEQFQVNRDHLQRIVSEVSEASKTCKFNICSTGINA